MPIAPEVKRKYTMPDADLIQRADDMTNTASRDLADLTPRGLTPAKITALKTARDTFSNFPTDIELQGDVTVAVEAKNTQRDQLITAIADIRSMAEAKYGTKGYYKSFGFDDLSRLSDNSLVRCARRVARVGTTLQPQMTAQGLTLPIIGALKTLGDNFDTAIDMVEAAIETRDLKTQDRINAGNAVFTQLMDIAKLGQGYYMGRDQAKYNDYIINDAPPPSPDGPIGPVTPPNPNA